MASNIDHNEIICSICVNYLIDPVTIGDFTTNIVLETRVFLARQARPYHLLSSIEKMCEMHRKTKNFCEVRKDLLCLLCCKSKEHVAHRHCSIDWTAEEYRQKLLKQIRSLWEKMQEKPEKSGLSEGVSLALRGRERRYLERIEKESKEIFQQLRESEDSMALTGKLLRRMYEDLKKMCRKPGMELLWVKTEKWRVTVLPGSCPYSLCPPSGLCNDAFLGFCDDSWAMRNDMVLDLEGIFLLFCIKEDNQCSLFTSSPLLPQYVERPLGHVEVFLDYECGVVTFVHVANSALICSFLSCSFSCPLQPFLCSTPS
ncbi:tripartite motif-containing protein 43-like [Ursus americanus]|uniref:tripartite motif-containing protein 43-like n=1 Tax=Ursus americanus TaxID=9643 RepID=UPI001E6793CF|nr:tripartite motif-containing protein 43-like [Ursus americanus]